METDACVTSHGLEYPVIVKPNSTDGSFGITSKSVAHNDEELISAVHDIRNVFFIDCPILVQEYLTGRDVNVGLLGYDDQGVPIVLPITEEDYNALPADLPKICGFESKVKKKKTKFIKQQLSFPV